MDKSNTSNAHSETIADLVIEFLKQNLDGKRITSDERSCYNGRVVNVGKDRKGIYIEYETLCGWRRYVREHEFDKYKIL